jgi:hypothetical protein
MAYVIFDLDGTVIDTSHRYRNLPNGHIDLEYWFANSIPEKIAQDALLPLADSMRKMYDAGHHIIVCTARDFSPLNGVDLGMVYRHFLIDNDLFSHAILHRTMAGPDHKTLGDGELKIRLLEDYFQGLGFSCASAACPIMWDDNLNVIDAMLSIGVTCFNATKYNKRLGG